MKKVMLTICLVGLFVVQGCAMTEIKPQARQAIFIQSEYASYDIPGTSKITGQAFLKTRGGDVKYGAACQIHLNPVTSLSTEWFEKGVKEGILLKDLPSNHPAWKYHHVTMGDGEGRFEFENLPSGEYYLMCPIYWEIVVGGRYPYTTVTGANTYSQIAVENDKITKCIVTR